jgi:multiple sugar transport system permease protein
VNRWRRAAIPYLLLLPAFVLVGLVVIYPIARSIHLSFQSFNLLDPASIGTWVGLQNFQKAINDRLFWLALRQTIIWVVAVVPTQLVLGLVVALLLNRDFPFRGIVRSLVLIPWVFPGVLNALMWTWMYDGNYGVINDILVRLGILSSYFPFLARTQTALPSIIVTTIWQGTPFFAIMLLAALQAIPDELYEAARIDGASSWQEFRHITIPSILPTMIITTLLRTIWVSNYIEIIFVMTGGGPGYASLTLAVYTFLQAYTDLNFGYAAALSLFLVLMLIAVVLVYVAYLRRAELKLR